MLAESGQVHQASHLSDGPQHIGHLVHPHLPNTKLAILSRARGQPHKEDTQQPARTLIPMLCTLWKVYFEHCGITGLQIKTIT